MMTWFPYIAIGKIQSEAYIITPSICGINEGIPESVWQTDKTIENIAKWLKGADFYLTKRFDLNRIIMFYPVRCVRASEGRQS